MVQISLERGDDSVADKLLSTKQDADMLGLHEETIRQYIKRGELLAIRLGKEYRIRESEVERFLQERQTGKDEHEEQ